MNGSLFLIWLVPGETASESVLTVSRNREETAATLRDWTLEVWPCKNKCGTAVDVWIATSSCPRDLPTSKVLQTMKRL